MSFAQEIKDFLGAATNTYKLFDDAAYSKIKRAHMQAQTDKLNQDLNDPTIREARQANIDHTKASTNKINTELNDPTIKAQRQANLDATKSGIAATNQRTSYYRTREDLINDQRKMLANPPALPGPSDEDISGATSRMPPAIGAPQRDPYDSTNYMAHGGLVQKFANGGMVEDEDLDPNDEDDAPPATISTDVSAQSRRPQISEEAGHDAVKGGLLYGTSQLGGAGIPSPARQQRMMALRRGEGAAPLADMNAIYKKIDPNNEMSESQRNMAAMSAVYQWKLRTGDEKGAQRAAFMMLQHYRLASQRYAAIAAAAVENNDIDGAAKAAMKAYANIPDGRDLKIHRDAKGQLVYMSTDAEGKTVSQGIASPQQLAAAAMGVATDGFDQFLLNAAGQRAATKGAVGGKAGKTGGAPRESDKGKALESLDGAYKGALPEKEDGSPALNPDEERSLKGNAYRIYSANPNLTHSEALNIAMRLTSPNRKNPEEVGFAAKKLEDGGYAVKVGKGPAIRIGEDDFETMASIRAEKLAALKKAAEAKDKEGPGLLSEAAGAVRNFASNKADELTRDYPETVARTKSAINTGVRAIGDATDWVKRKAPEAAGAITDMAIGGPSGFAARQIKRRLEE